MKIHLLRSLVCLTAALSFVDSFVPRVTARELGLGDFHHSAFTANCLNFEQAEVAVEPDCEAVQASWGASLTTPLAILESFRTSVLQAWEIHRTSSGFPPVAASPSSEMSARPTIMLVNTPDAGNPPSPKVERTQLAKRSLLKWQFIESYKPYDLAVRDWKFGQFSQQVLEQSARTTATLARMPLVDPNKAIHVLGQILERMEDVQCRATEEPASMHIVGQWSQLALEGMLKAHRKLAVWVAGQAQNILPSTPTPPYFTQPVFVAYETADGWQVILPLEEARAWNLVKPIGEVSRTQPNVGSPIAEFLVAEFLHLEFVSDLLPRIAEYQQHATRLSLWLANLIDQRIAWVQTAQEFHY